MCRILLILLAGLLFAPKIQAFQESTSNLEARLENLCAELEAKREEFDVAGMGYALFRGDKILLARGFGLADIENSVASDADTFFSIGSSTKAFTTTLVAMLSEDGKLAWDDPVAKHIPWFDPEVKGEGGDRVLLRDLACHRVGYPRMGILWASGKVDEETLLRTASLAKPMAPFRKQFLYNNVMYLALGEAAAAAGGKPWEGLLKERILNPLGMEQTVWTVSAARDGGKAAVGYLWEKDEKRFKAVEPQSVGRAKPAGAIWSSANEMARWGRFQLNRGKVGGTSIIDSNAIEETWETQIEMGAGAGYALGWMTEEWQGHRVVHHAGNVNGFSAMVAFLPDDDLGCVALANASVTPLVSIVPSTTWKHMLGPAPGKESGKGLDLGEFLGRYHADFATWENDVFTVSEKEGVLHLDVPGQMDFALNPPDEEGKWAFALTDTIKISFDRDDDGNVTEINMFQGPMMFELPREGVERAPEIPLDDLEPYLGTYRNEGQVWSIVIHGDRLAVDVPSEMVYELHPPDEDGKWKFRATDSMALSFDMGEDGRAEHLHAHKNGEVVLELERAPDSEEMGLAGIEDLRRARGTSKRRAATANLGGLRFECVMDFPHAGIEAEMEILADGNQRLFSFLDAGIFGNESTYSDGETGWLKSDFQEDQEFGAAKAFETLLGSPWTLLAPWEDIFGEVKVIKRMARDKKSTLKVRLTPSIGDPWTVWVDEETGQVLELHAIATEQGLSMPLQQTFSDWSEIAGISYPVTTEIVIPGNARFLVRVKDVETGLTFSDDDFRP